MALEGGGGEAFQDDLTLLHPAPQDDPIFLPLHKQQHIAQRRASTGTAATEAETTPCPSTSDQTLESVSSASGAHGDRHPGGQSSQQQPRRRNSLMLAERRVSFSGTDRVREFNLGESERRMKIEAKRESKKARKQMKREGERIDISASADDIVPDEGGGGGGGGSSGGGNAPPPASALRRTHSADAAGQEGYGDPAMFDDPFSAERVVSSLFTSLINTTSSGAAASGDGGGEPKPKPKPKRRSSHDGITTAMSVMDEGGGTGGTGSTSSTNSTSSTGSTGSAGILAAARNRRRASIADGRARRRSLDLWSAPAGTGRLTSSSTTATANANTAPNTAASTTGSANSNATPSTRANQRRSSLELWSAPKRRISATATTTATGTTIDRSTPPTTLLRSRSGDALSSGRGIATTNTSSANHRPMEGLAQPRLMSAASRRLSPSGGGSGGGSAVVSRRRNSMMAAAPTTGAELSFTMPLNDADAAGGDKRRSSNSRRRHSLDALSRAMDMSLGDKSAEGKNIVIINGKRIQRRSMARRRTSLEMEDEPNAADVLDYMCQPQNSRSQLVLMDPETRRQIVKADAERARAARRRHSITIMPRDGWMDTSYVETTFTNDAGTLGLRRTQSFDGSVLPSVISAKEMTSEKVFPKGTNYRKGEDYYAGTVGTPDTELSSDEHGLDGTSFHGGDDNSACRTASSSCVAVRRGSQEKQHLHNEEAASTQLPLNITIHQRSRPSSEATAKPDPRQRRSSDSDVGRPPVRRTGADRTVDNLFTMKSSRTSATGTAEGGPMRRSSRDMPRRLSSHRRSEAGTLGPQKQDKKTRQNRDTRNQQQQHQQKQSASVLSGVYSQGRRRHSMGTLSSFLTWHREEKHQEGGSGGSTDAIQGAETAEESLPKSTSLSDIQLGLAMELIQNSDSRGMGKATK
mmetsp:Transcript_24262/g.69771  ORF Transcript_24262/g.69771 Transcript_24262/m.69771 type:complete len:921 (+) Transcript_24262:456-3218(+)